MVNSVPPRVISWSVRFSPVGSVMTCTPGNVQGSPTAMIWLAKEVNAKRRSRNVKARCKIDIFILLFAICQRRYGVLVNVNSVPPRV